MKKELEEKLINDFPNLYCETKLSPQESCMHWGFECDDGWFNIIYRLSWAISIICPECVATQVKEKFGGLRFYYYVNYSKQEENDNIQFEILKKTTIKELVDYLVDKAEEESLKTCELCGSTNNISKTHGWIKTLCESCKKKIKKQ